ncbi:MAG: hypothetical protein ACK48H_04670 [Microcystis sp.]|uniref:hypothetical protein n=1 Tax=Microcystis sp. TaxID=1127 RepID=UPI00391B827A
MGLRVRSQETGDRRLFYLFSPHPTPHTPHPTLHFPTSPLPHFPTPQPLTPHPFY